MNLLIVDQDRRSRWYELSEGTTKVGRGSDNDLVLTGRGVSRHHALFKLDAGTLTVQDLDSTYGTRVNGRMIRKKVVELGDPIDIGVFRVLPLPAALPGSRGQTESADLGMGDLTPVETAEYTLPQGLGQRIVMDSQNPSSDEFPTDEVSGLDVLPPGVQIVDGWGQDALARVLRKTRDVGSSDWEGEALSLLQELAKQAASRTETRAALREALDTLARLVRCEVAVFLEMTGDLDYRALAIWQHEKARGDVPLSRTVINKAVRERSAVISENLAADPDFRAMDSVHIRKVGALLALPMVVEDDVVGVLYLSRQAGATFSDEEVQLAEVVAAVAAGALRAKRLSKMLRNRQRYGLALEKVVDPVVRRRLLEARVPRFLKTTEATILVLHLGVEPGGAESEEDVAGRLADLFGAVAEVAARNGGLLVDVGPDMVSLGFGLENPSRTDAMWAITAAFEIMGHFEAVVAKRWGGRLSVGLGLASGNVMWGVIDFPGRAVQVIMGETVRAARALAQMGGGQAVIASEETINRISSPAFKAEPVASEGPYRAFRLMVR